MSNILVTGSRGQLGSEIETLSDRYNHIFFFTDSTILDITKADKVNDFFKKNKIDVIINSAAYTAIDKAEKDKENANLVNHLAVKNLAKISKKMELKLIHISTDYIFNGENFKPYIEIDETSANGIYGQTKLDGEKAMKIINSNNSIIIRSSWVYSSFGNNFVKTMLRLGKEKENLGGISDQVGTPTYARDLARVILDIIPHINNDKVEAYHYTNEGVLSWYDFAKEIMKMVKFNPIETKAYPSPAKRPHYSVLNKTKIKETFNLEIPYWKDSLSECLIEIGARK